MNEEIIVPALDRGLNIIEYLVKKKEPVSLKQIAGDLSIPTASAFRMIKNLTGRGYVQEIDAGQLQYLLGSKIMMLACLCSRGMSLNRIAKPFMERLTEQTGQTSQLAVISGFDVVYIEQCFPQAPASVIVPLHSAVPVNVSAAGKIMLAQFSESELDRFEAAVKLPRKTERTITDWALFRKELAESASRGYTLDNEEFAQGIGCMAAPIFDFSMACVGAVGITGGIQHYRDKDSQCELAKIIISAARQISEMEGYIPENK